MVIHRHAASVPHLLCCSGRKNESGISPPRPQHKETHRCAHATSGQRASDFAPCGKMPVVGLADLVWGKEAWGIPLAGRGKRVRTAHHLPLHPPRLEEQTKAAPYLTQEVVAPQVEGETVYIHLQVKRRVAFGREGIPVVFPKECAESSTSRKIQAMLLVVIQGGFLLVIQEVFFLENLAAPPHRLLHTQSVLNSG